MAQNVRRGFSPRWRQESFFYNLVIMHWTLNIIYVQFECQCPKWSNVSVEPLQVLSGMFGFFEPREMLRSFHVDPSQLGGYVV